MRALDGGMRAFFRPAGQNVAKPAQLTEEFLTSRVWRFRVKTGHVFANAIRLWPGGAIVGHSHPNESAWRIEGGRLALLDHGGERSCVLTLQSGTPTMLMGKFLGGGWNVHVLEEVTPDPFYPLHLAWQDNFLGLLEDKKIFLGPGGAIRGVRWPGDQIRLTRPAIAEFRTTLSGGHFYTSGYLSYAIGHQLEPGSVEIGRYTSIAKGVEVLGHAHPIDRISTHPFTYMSDYAEIASEDFNAAYQPTEFAQRLPPPVTIGNDVWIGADVLLKGGIHIGDGAVIAARSVVTHDVAPYSIVAGTPARLLRMRFPPEMIKAFAEVEWWNYRYSDLPGCWSDIPRFLHEMQIAIAGQRLQPYHPEQTDIGAAFVKLILQDAERDL